MLSQGAGRWCFLDASHDDLPHGPRLSVPRRGAGRYGRAAKRVKASFFAGSALEASTQTDGKITAFL